MKILVLQGKGYTGKTTVLKSLIRTFERDGRFSVTRIEPEIYGGKKRTKQRDEMAVVEASGNKIGIATGGETAAQLSGAFDILKTEERCRTIVCPAYTGGETVDFLEGFSKGSTIIWYGKAYTSVKKEQGTLNAAECERLFGEIGRLCGPWPGTAG